MIITVTMHAVSSNYTCLQSAEDFKKFPSRTVCQTLPYVGVYVLLLLGATVYHQHFKNKYFGVIFIEILDS